jgi:LacI family transcriptional regulator
MQGKLTIQDIARLAGVSKATVSRVLNRNPSVDPVLTARVLDVIKEHNFVPNITATVLASGRTPLIGVITPPLNWPAMPEILHGVSEYIENTTYEIVLYSISQERNHADVLNRILAMRMVSGLLAIFPGKLIHHLTAFHQQGLPLVIIDDQETPTDIPWVGVDNRASAYTATRYLLSIGHRHIAHIQGPQTYYCAQERYQGYYQALCDAGIEIDPSWLLQGDFTKASGRQCATTLFSRERDTWPSAIFTGNDEMAYGLLEVAEEQGIRIPEDITIIGFDDYMLSAHVRPPLTTIQQPFSAIGRKAVTMLLRDIAAHDSIDKSSSGQRPSPSAAPGENSQPPRIQLPTDLIVRASSSAPRPPT